MDNYKLLSLFEYAIFFEAIDRVFKNIESLIDQGKYEDATILIDGFEMLLGVSHFTVSFRSIIDSIKFDANPTYIVVRDTPYFDEEIVYRGNEFTLEELKEKYVNPPTEEFEDYVYYFYEVV